MWQSQTDELNWTEDTIFGYFSNPITDRLETKHFPWFLFKKKQNKKKTGSRSNVHIYAKAGHLEYNIYMKFLVASLYLCSTGHEHICVHMKVHTHTSYRALIESPINA